jgi:hypothetical protein
VPVHPAGRHGKGAQAQLTETEKQRGGSLRSMSTCPLMIRCGLVPRYARSIRRAIRGLANVLQMGGFVAPADGVDAVVQGVGNAWR